MNKHVLLSRDFLQLSEIALSSLLRDVSDIHLYEALAAGYGYSSILESLSCELEVREFDVDLFLNSLRQLHENCNYPIEKILDLATSSTGCADLDYALNNANILRIYIFNGGEIKTVDTYGLRDSYHVNTKFVECEDKVQEIAHRLMVAGNYPLENPRAVVKFNLDNSLCVTILPGETTGHTIIGMVKNLPDHVMAVLDLPPHRRLDAYAKFEHEFLPTIPLQIGEVLLAA